MEIIIYKNRIFVEDSDSQTFLCSRLVVHGHESIEKLMVHKHFVKNSQWSVYFSWYVLSYHDLAHFLGKKSRKTKQPTKTLCSFYLLRHLCKYTHTHRHSHTLEIWIQKKNTALLLLFVSIKSTIKIYPSISDILPIKILYTCLHNLLVSFLTSQEYF